MIILHLVSVLHQTNCCSAPDYHQFNLSYSSSDYYILENNSVLKAVLKYKRIQKKEYQTVRVEPFGEDRVLCYCRLLATGS